MDALCYGFRSFGQLDKDPFLSILSQHKRSRDNESSSVQFVNYSWSKCYIVLSDNSLIVQGFIDLQIASKKQIFLPFDDKLRKVLCLKNYDLFLTEKGQCWKYIWNGSDSESFVELWRDYKNERKDRKIIDLAANDDLQFLLFDTGVLSDPHNSMVLPEVKIKKVCCGFEHNVALSQGGSVYVWGIGSRGQLGNGSLVSVENPELLEILDGLFVNDIAVGGWHSVAVTVCGALYSWGWNHFGQLGFRNDRISDPEPDDSACVSVLPEPRLVEWPNNIEVIVKQVACGNSHTMVLSDDGFVWGCGNNKYRQLNPHLGNEFFDQMIRVPVSESVKSINGIACAQWNSTLYVSYL